MANRRVLVFSEKTPHPGDAFAAHDVIGVDHRFETGDCGHVSAHYEDRVRRKLPHHPAHFPDLADVDDDAGDPDDVVVVLGQFAGKAVARGKIQHRARRGNICLNHHDAPRAVKHPRRKAALRSRNLIVEQLHRIDGPASEFVILRVGAKDRAEQHARRNTLSGNFHLNFQNSPFDFRGTNRQPLVEDYSTAVEDWGAVRI